MRAKLITISAGIGIFLGIIFFFAIRAQQPREPSYQGRSLSSWLEDMAVEDTNLVLQARTAVRRMGTNALPFLLDVLSHEKSSLRKQLEYLAEQSPVRFSFLEHNSMKRLEAAEAINALGALAEPEFSTLTNLFYSGKSMSAGIALAGVGEKGVRFLVNTATNHNSEARFVKTATLALGSAQSDFATVVPVLVQILHKTNSLARVNAALSLGSLRRKPEIAVPALMESLKDADATLHPYIIFTLGEFGSDAKAAVAMLREAQKSEDETIRYRAKLALQKIAPEILDDSKPK